MTSLLSCIYEGKVFNSDDDSFSEIEKRLMGKALGFTCPICENAVYYNSKGKRVSHFSHYPGTACDELKLKGYDFDDEIHDLAKTVFAAWIKSQFPLAHPVKDKFLPGIRQLADVYFEYCGMKVAIEVQFKHITPETLLERHENYKNAGIKDLWFFVRGEDFEPGSPYERHYYAANGRELYYIDLAARTITYYKGLKNEKFDKAGVPLKHYIKDNCPLEAVTLNPSGSLLLPGLREKYAQQLVVLRKHVHLNIRKRKDFRNDALQRLKQRIDYQNKHPEKEKPETVVEVQKKLAASKTSKKPVQKRAVQELEYEKLLYYTKGKKNYVEFSLNHSDKTYSFEVLSMDEIKGIKFLTCRSTEGKGYIVKVYEDRNIFTLEDWF